jgi:hypothetical protein
MAHSIKWNMRIPAILLISLLVLPACTIPPKPVIRYRSAGPGELWDNGLSTQRAESDRFAFTSAFLELPLDAVRGDDGPRALTFQIAAENRSESARLIDPEAFRIAIPGKDSALPAIDPEAVILQARRDKAAEDAAYATGILVQAPFQAIAGIASVASHFVTRTPEEEKRDRQAEADQRRSDSEAEKNHLGALAEADARENHWAQRFLRKTTLAPGMRIQGRVGFAADAYRDTPDTLLLRFRRADGSFAELGRFARFRDSAEIVAKTAALAADSAWDAQRTLNVTLRPHSSRRNASGSK